MLINILIAVAVVIIWAICSGIIWRGLVALKEGTIYEQIQYDRMSAAFRCTLVFFAPIVLLVNFFEFLFGLWKYLLVIAGIVGLCVWLTGCQVNVVTAPHATFMVDSVTAESIDQGIYDRTE